MYQKGSQNDQFNQYNIQIMNRPDSESPMDYEVLNLAGQEIHTINSKSSLSQPTFRQKSVSVSDVNFKFQTNIGKGIN